MIRARIGSSFAGEVLARALALALVWYALTDGAASSWAIGAPVVLAAAAASLALAPEPVPRLRLLPLLAFLPFFVAQSVRGGADVAARALRPGVVPLEPGFTTFSVTPLGAAERVVFALLVSLLPGTLSARLEGDQLRVHVLDQRLPIERSLALLAHRLTPVFGRAPSD